MASIWGYALHGVEAIPVRVEAHVRTGLPGMTIVGLPGAAVKEARERIRSGAAASRLPLPTRRITVNLSPADLMTEGAGHEHGRRALEVSAAGGHHILMVGPPGSGKSMLARRVPSILPGLTEEERRVITRIHSAAGLRAAGDLTPLRRPFRAPHHSASRTAIVGGGPVPRPGEVTLAHLGVLFLDEMVEFSRDVLEALRQPLEDGFVTISRKSGTMEFPARCTLVAAINPCPCGFRLHPKPRKPQWSPLDWGIGS